MAWHFARRILSGLLLFAGTALSSPEPPSSLPTPPPALTVRSPKGRFLVQFSEPRTVAREPSDALWSVVTVRDLEAGTVRVAHSATGRRGSGDSWQGFRAWEGREPWSPDGLYLVYVSCGCLDQEGFEDFDAVCHDELAFLPMLPPPSGRHELALGQLAFGGWVPNRRHTLFEIDLALSDGTRHRVLPWVADPSPSGSSR